MGLTVKGQSPWNTRTPRSALRFSTKREFRGPYASPRAAFLDQTRVPRPASSLRAVFLDQP